MTPPKFVGFDMKGNLLPHTEGEVQGVMAKMMIEGELLIAIVETPTALGVHIFKDPCEAVAVALEQLAQSYRKMLPSARSGS